MSDLISRDELLRYVNDRIGRIKEIRDSAKENGEEDVFAHCNGEITEARRTKRYLYMSAPDVDAIPVVRCKDCKNRGTPYSCPMRKLVMPWQGAGSYEDCTEDEGFCHMGVKKDGDSE